MGWRMTFAAQPIHERFAAQYIPEPMSGCWLWTSWVDRHGYGRLKKDGRMKLAHRASYEMTKGEIPAGLEIDHLCRNPSCVNPDHLEAVTRHENILRSDAGAHLAQANLAKTHCPKGHPYSGENLARSSKGYRLCRECGRIACRERYAKKPKVGAGKGSFQRAKTHCPQGHEYSIENTRFRARGSRDCKACNRISARARKKRVGP